MPLREWVSVFFQTLMTMTFLDSNAETSTRKITWVNVLNAVIQALIAALTALGVSSCVKAL